MAIEQRKYEGGDIFINPKEKVINPNAIGMQNFIFSHYVHTKWEEMGQIIRSTLHGFIFLPISKQLSTKV